MEPVACLRRAWQWFIATAVAGAVTLTPFGASASPPISEDAPVPGGIAALARALDIDAPDQARCLTDVARLVYGDNAHARARVDSPYRRLLAYLASASSANAGGPPTDIVPIPLTARVWSGAVFGRPVSPDTLFATILSDPDAALLAHGLSALDDETLQFFADHPAVLSTLYRRHATVFASFATHLRIHNNRVVPPGADVAVPLWEAVVEERVSNPASFVISLYANDKGRMAYLYDVIGHLDQPRAAFVLGTWLPNSSERRQRFQQLARQTASAMTEWNATYVPFSRPVFDLLALAQRVQVDRFGTPQFPAAKALWAAALSGDDRPLQEQPAGSLGGQPIDAAWLVELVLTRNSSVRSDRLDQVAFGHRVFASALSTAAIDVVDTIRSFPRFSMLMLTLDRIGVRSPALYAALARHAQQISRLDAELQRRVLEQFQGAIVLTERMVRAQTVDRRIAEQWLAALALLPIDPDHGYLGGVPRWLTRHVRPAIESVEDVSFDEALVGALAGRGRRAAAAPLVWEGQTYVFDLAASEISRLRRFLQRHGSASLEAALGLCALAHAVAGAPVPGAAAAAATLFHAADIVASDAFVAFAYAIHSNEPQGLARLDRDLPRRHDFGLTSSLRDVRARGAWTVPRLTFRPGEAWRVEGALLGLDVALAPLEVRRMAAIMPRHEPRMLSTNRHSFMTSVGLLNTFALHDADADAIAEAVARGQQRVEALTPTSADVPAVIEHIALDGSRARALRWNLLHAPERVPVSFSLTELLLLGGGERLDVHAWGMSGLAVIGCLCTHVPMPGLQTALIGRPQLGLLPITIPDLHLRVAILLREWQMPAALAKYVLGAALHDLFTDARPAHTDDWLSVVRRARAISRDQVADYLAAVAAAAGPLSPPHAARREP